MISSMERIYKNSIGLCLAMLCWFVSQAQRNDTLPAVIISHERVPNFRLITSFDSAQKMRSAGLSMADMISASGQAYIKQYGPGNIATANMRGGSSYHTSLLWNGINLSNPMLGNADLSIFPAIFSDVNEVVHGTSSALWGSGSVAGSFNIENTTGFYPHLSALAGAEYSTLHSFNTYAKISGGNKRSFGSARVYAQQGKNDFNFYNPFTNTEQTLRHAENRQAAFFGEGGYKINLKSMIHAVGFVNRSQRMIAPLFTESVSGASQTDENLRGLIYWKRYFSSSVLVLRTAVIGDKVVYADSLRSFDETSVSLVIPVEAEWKKLLKNNHRILIYAGYRPAMANYQWKEENIIQQNIATLAQYYWHTRKRKFSGSFSGRYENSGGKQPATVAAEIHYHPIRNFTLQLRGSTLYRLPTLNDLYWHQGGNPDLKPENGFSFDGALLLDNSWTLRTKLTFEGRVFYRNVTNWIQWAPGAVYWSPQNIDHVVSYGGETKSQMLFAIKKQLLIFRLNTLYAVSEPVAGINKGNQLLYSPMYSGNIEVEFRNKYMWVAYSHYYTGYRYTSSDNYLYLEPYYFAQAETGVNLIIKKNILSVSGGVKNIFDQEYQSVANRPMPGRWFFARIQIHFKK